MIWVAKTLIMMQTIMPTAINRRGNRSNDKCWGQSPRLYKVSEEMTKAAHVDSANEPKRSALIPATSPTLSPTLSAIVAGFLGLSSGKFF